MECDGQVNGVNDPEEHPDEDTQIHNSHDHHHGSLCTSENGEPENHTRDHNGTSPSFAHDSFSLFTENEQAEEKQHFRTVISAFHNYSKYALKKIGRQEGHFKGLPEEQRNKIPSFLGHIDALRQCTDVNNQFLLKVLSHAPFDQELAGEEPEKNRRSPVGSFHMDKVQTTLRMFMRDWSRDGEAERRQAYQPLMDAVERYYPRDQMDVSQIHILNPGSGLGRLSWELAKLGYTSIGNEFSLYMLFASNFVLNCCTEVDCYKIYPWLSHASNNISSADQLKDVSIPDVNPAGDLPEKHSFGMVAGDFLEVFEPDASWDAVVSCFFVDTARNIIDYVEHIWNLLKPGAFWMNLGPLLYHFADMANECCIELSYEELKSVLLSTGFLFLEERLDVPCMYVQNPRSMLRYEYRCIYFVVQKPF